MPSLLFFSYKLYYYHNHISKKGPLKGIIGVILKNRCLYIIAQEAHFLDLLDNKSEVAELGVRCVLLFKSTRVVPCRAA